MLKQDDKLYVIACTGQPPSGGCVLKLDLVVPIDKTFMQPPSGGCVLKLSSEKLGLINKLRQPPSGGCVLKLVIVLVVLNYRVAAAFGRLCVETCRSCQWLEQPYAAAFGRLCVETFLPLLTHARQYAAAFGRLCVETFLTFR